MFKTDYSGHWAENSIYWALKQSIVRGYEDGSFQPDRIVSEAEFLSMLIRLFPDGRSRAAELSATGEASEWSDPYYKLSSDAEYGLPTMGLTDTSARNKPITRGMVARMIAGTAGNNAPEDDAIRYLYVQGLSDGKTERTIAGFAAADSLTRAEAVQFLQKMADKGLNRQLHETSQVSPTAASLGQPAETTKPSTSKGNPESVVLKVKADPSKGFYWDYYMKIPVISPTRPGPLYLLVEPNNNGVLDSIEAYDLLVKNEIESSTGHAIARQLNVPYLIPVFPRYQGVYTHSLDRNTMQITSGNLQRLDLQLLAMIRDAQQRITERGLKVEQKVFMNGFSASAKFVERFSVLHPEEVRALTIGGVSGFSMIPAAEWEGTKLPYPIGTADQQSFTGHPFDLVAYNKVSRYIYMGELDDNDYFQSNDPTDLVNRLFGRRMMPERWNKTQTVLAKLGSTAQFVTYPKLGHSYKNKLMTDDIVYFFKVNGGEDNVQITPFVAPADRPKASP
ncbi:S-layer homology domain-containing protein [Paenibacillus solanacearum]|uniref:S-layer homology domain-containing protein n=1 Tax=Paenibacillus solanacearum TaxID=2048548 RepID=UPI001C4026FD|nr:S-layer homology domain-containing protein [Paenibacillus solanacearum]